MRIFDSETCGFRGPMVLLQYHDYKSNYDIDLQDVKLWHIFEERIADTLKLIEEFVAFPVVGFNLSYDWFHLTKIYNILRACSDHNKIPDIDEVIDIEGRTPNRSDTPYKYCLRPVGALDLMLYAQRGKYQAAMKRRSITIRKIPVGISGPLSLMLRDHIPLDELYFQTKPYEWKIIDIIKPDGSLDKDFVDLRLDFDGKTTLEAICSHAFKAHKGNWPIPDNIVPTEVSYLPHGQHGARPWGNVIREHIFMWHKDRAQYYARQDVVLTTKLLGHFYKEESHDPAVRNFVNNNQTDTDSFLACMIGATRVKGFAVHTDDIGTNITKLQQIGAGIPTAPAAARRWLESVCTSSERCLITGTDKVILESVSQWVKGDDKHPAAIRAEQILDARRAEKRIELLNKISELPSFHPEFKIIGTKSSRLSGGSDNKDDASLNPHGIPRDKDFRKLFTFGYAGETVHGGDADSYEVSIMDAEFDDPNLRADLSAGKKFHALIWADLFELSYDEFLTKPNKEKYDRSKNGTFAWAYGGTDEKVAKTVGKETDKVTITLEKVNNKYPGIKRARDQIYDDFCSMRQPRGIGTKVIWAEPKDYCESLLGFRRYFTLENYICKKLFDFANKIPAELREKCDVTKTVRRRDKDQTILGSIQSALYACAFNIQAGNLRQAGNHRIQATGGQITKEGQRSLYELQPIGIHEYVIRVFNVHDELISVDNGTVDTTTTMSNFITKYRKYVPLLKWGWHKMNSWADK